MSELASSPFMQKIASFATQVKDRLAVFPLSFWKGLIVILALVWICKSLASLFWLIFPVPDIPVPDTIASVQSAPVVTQAESVDVAKLQSFHLFGKAKSDLPVAKPEEKEPQLDIGDGTPEETNLSLQLQGIIASSLEGESKAIIADGQSQELYSIGDKMPQGNNVKLVKVLEQHVIIRNNGKAESLWLYSEDDFKNSPQRAEPKNTSFDRSQNRFGRRPPGRGPEQNVSIKAKVSDVPKTLNDVVRFSVYRKDGKMQGYRVRPGRNAKMFENAGLKTGDIVTSVNGIQVDDPKKIRSVYDSLKESSGAQLEILRNGATNTINISLDSGG